LKANEIPAFGGVLLVFYIVCSHWQLVKAKMKRILEKRRGLCDVLQRKVVGKVTEKGSL
jgi:hypothetical protein